MTAPSSANAKFETLLVFLRQTRGFDFSGYKRPSLMRRVDKRMEMVNIKRRSPISTFLCAGTL